MHEAESVFEEIHPPVWGFILRLFRNHASEVELFRKRVDGEFFRGLASGTLMGRLSLTEVTLSSWGAPLSLVRRSASALQQYLILFVEDK